MIVPLVTARELRGGIESLGLAGADVMIHVSLRSFGRVDGGPATLVDAFLDLGCTLLVPTMANEAFAIPAPPGDRPRRNAVDYDEKDASAARAPWPGMSDVYDHTRNDVDDWVGVVPAEVLRRPERVRCRWPAGALTAIGPNAAALIAAETTDDMFGPMRELARRGGTVVLMGVGLDRMTLLHLAEVEAGRRPFIYWARGADGAPVRSMGGACSDGFPRLDEVLAPIERVVTVGTSRWRAFDAADAVTSAAAAIRSDPEITRCSASCRECDDAVAGGPLDD